MQIKQFYPYSPRKADFEQLSYAFVARESLLEELVNSIREQANAEAIQHWMILGMRGMGKSHLIALLYHTVKNNAELNRRWVPLLMHEEEQSVFSLHTLFIRFLMQLGEEIADSDKEKSRKIFDFLDSQRDENKKQEDILESVVAFLKDYVRETGKRLLIFMENSDDIFSRYISKKNDIKQFRNMLQHDNFMMLVATSPTFFTEISKPTAPLYQFFRIRNLDLLTYDQAVDLLNRWRQSDTQAADDNSSALPFDRDDYKLMALHHLTGGNPRVLLFLYMAIKGQDGIRSAVDTFSKLLEEDLSNYYLSRLRDLSNQVQPIILALAESDRNLTQKEIAQKTFLPMKSIGTAMVRLEKDSQVRPVTEKKGKNTLYTLTDHLFRLWHQWRISAHNKEIIRAVVMCLAVWYKKQELEQWSVCDDITGIHCKEALKYRTTEHFKSLWMPIHKEGEAMIVRYLQNGDLQNFDKTLAMLQETGIESDKLLVNVVKDLINMDDVDSTLKFIEKHLKDKNVDEDVLLELGCQYCRQEKFMSAEETFKKVIEIVPINLKAWLRLGHVLVNLRKNAEAEDAFDKVIELDQNIAEAWSGLGHARGRQGNYLGAEAAFKRSVELNSKDVEALKGIGSACIYQKKHAEAESAFEKAVELDPKNAETWEWLGGARINQKKYAEAESAFEKAVEFGQKNAGVWEWLGVARANQEKFKEAESAFEKAIELDPKSTEVWKRLGGACFDQENYTKAEAIFEKAVKLDPKDANAWVSLGIARYNQEKYKEAKEAFERAIKFDPNHAEAWKWLGAALNNRGNYTEAEAIFEKAVNLDPKDAKIWQWLGGALINQRKYVEAEPVLERAVNLEPKDVETWKRIGVVRFLQKDYQGAEIAFHKRINLNPFEKEGYGNLLEALVVNNRVPDMLPTLDNTLSLKDAEIDFKAFIHFIQAFVFLHQQDRSPFLKDLNQATVFLKECVEEKKHELLGAVTEFLTDTLRKNNIAIHRSYVAELRNISTELSVVFRPLDFVLDYFEVVFSPQKDKKAKTDKARRILDSVPGEIREPVEKMIEKIKGNL